MGHKKKNKKPAQHLVEFIIFFPFLIGIIGLLSELGFGLNTGIELNSALSSAVNSVSTKTRTQDNSSLEAINQEIRNETKGMLVGRLVPYLKDDEVLNVETLMTEDFLVSIATYKYTMAFELANLFFHSLPKEFVFSAVAITNNALFLPNSFQYTNDNLKEIFKAYAEGKVTDTTDENKETTGSKETTYTETVSPDGTTYTEMQ